VLKLAAAADPLIGTEPARPGHERPLLAAHR
jgi:hypothetical protein